MSTSTPPRRPRTDLPSDTEALEALIEEARRRTRRRRRGQAAFALAAVAAVALGVYGFDNGGETTGPAAEQPAAAMAALERGNWQAAAGLEGGNVTALAFAGTDAESLLATTLLGGIAKSSDGGTSWQDLSIGPVARRFDVLAVAPRDPRTVYAGGDRILKSTDGGATWSAADSGLFAEETAERREHRRLEGFVSSLVVDPRNPEVVYAGGTVVRKTTDGGASWRRLSLDGAGPLVLHPGDPDTLYAGTENGIFTSDDGGTSWRSLGLRGRSMSALAVDPQAPETIYAGTFDKGLYKSTDGGESWGSAGLEGRSISGLTVHTQAPGTVYALSGSRIFASSDGGAAWRPLDAGGAPGSWSSALVLAPRDPATLYLGVGGGAGAGVFRSADGGHSWRPVNAGLTDARVSSIALDPNRAGAAFAAVDGRGVFRRVDGRWRAATIDLPDGARSVAVDPRQPATVYASTFSNVVKSTDGGTSWSSSTALTQGSAVVSALAVDPQNPATVYATTADAGGRYGGGVARIYQSLLLKSTDGGFTWRVHAEVQSLDVTAKPGDAEPSPVSETPLAIDPRRPQTLYAGGLGVRKSTDGGGTWQSGGLPRAEVLALALDPERPASLYAGTTGGLFTSGDAGATWQRSNGPLDHLRIEAVAIDPRGRGAVYAGTDRGVFWSADGGRSWQRFTRLPERAFQSLAVDTAAGIVYAGSDGRGLFELELR